MFRNIKIHRDVSLYVFIVINHNSNFKTQIFERNYKRVDYILTKNFYLYEKKRGG